MKYLDLSLEANPSYETSLNNLGVLQIQKGKLEEALSTLQKASDKDSDLTYVFSNIGDLYSLRNMPDSAYYYYDKALENDPTYCNALANKATEMHKNNPASSQYQSLCRQIIALESQSLKQNPQGYLHLSNRATAYQLLGKQKEMLADINKAMPIVNKLIDLHPDGYMLLKKRAEFYDMLGETQKAIADYKHVLKLCPENPYALNYIQENN